MLESYEMRLPADAVIPAEKLSQYLLVPRPWDDKAKFLAQAGFDRERPEMLMHALHELASQGDAVSDGANEYGELFRLDGILVGPNGRQLVVTTIWLRQHVDDQVRFVTLKPPQGECPMKPPLYERRTCSIDGGRCQLEAGDRYPQYAQRVTLRPSRQLVGVGRSRYRKQRVSSASVAATSNTGLDLPALGAGTDIDPGDLPARIATAQHAGTHQAAACSRAFVPCA
jgi:hypothetical protein